MLNLDGETKALALVSKYKGEIQASKDGKRGIKKEMVDGIGEERFNEKLFLFKRKRAGDADIGPLSQESLIADFVRHEKSIAENAEHLVRAKKTLTLFTADK